MPRACTIEKRVEFHETDQAGILNFTHYFRYMEMAESALVRSWGVPINEFWGAGGKEQIGWARVRVTCEYRQALFFNDLVQVTAYLVEKNSRALTLRFTFRRNSKEVASGEVTAVCVQGREREVRAIPIPADLNKLIDAALSEDPVP